MMNVFTSISYPRIIKGSLIDRWSPETENIKNEIPAKRQYEPSGPVKPKFKARIPKWQSTVGQHCICAASA